MKRVCAWCRCSLGPDKGTNPGTTDGICPDCTDRFLGRTKGGKMSIPMITTITMESRAGNEYVIDVMLSLSPEVYGSDADGNRGVPKVFYDVEKFSVVPTPAENEKQEVYDYIHEYDYSDAIDCASGRR